MQHKIWFLDVRCYDRPPNNFPNMLQARCSSFDLLEQSQTLHLAWSPTTTPSNPTSWQCWDEIQYWMRQAPPGAVTSLLSFQLTNQHTETIKEGGIILPIADSVGRRERWNNFQFQTQPPSAHLVNLLLIHKSGRRLALKLLQKLQYSLILIMWTAFQSIANQKARWEHSMNET